MQAVSERQALTTITRDEKVASRTLATQRDAYTGLEEKKAQLEGEMGTVTDRKAEVRGAR